MLVRNQLTGSRTGRSNTKTVNGVVQTSFKQLDQVLTRNTFTTNSFFECLAELTFQQTICIFRFLLFLQLQRILTRSLTLLCTTMLTGRIAVLGQILAIA